MGIRFLKTGDQSNTIKSNRILRTIPKRMSNNFRERSNEEIDIISLEQNKPESKATSENQVLKNGKHNSMNKKSMNLRSGKLSFSPEEISRV